MTAHTPALPVAFRATPVLADPAEPSLRVLAARLVRHRLLIAACIVVIVALGIAYTVHARRSYEAGALLRYEAERVNVPQLVEVLSDDNMLNTEVQVLQDRSAAIAVIDSLGFRARLVAPRSGRITALFALMRVPESADSGTLLLHSRGDEFFSVSRPGVDTPIALARIGDTTRVAGVTFVLGEAARRLPDIRLHVDLLDDAVTRFEAGLDVSRPARDADLIAVRYRGSDPVQAAAIANLLASNVIVDRQAASRDRTSSAMAFLAQQSDSLNRQLHAAEESLSGYQQREHVVDAPQQESDEVARLAALQANLAGVRADRDAFAQLVVQLRRDSVGGLPGTENVSRRLMAFPALLADQSAAVLLTALAQVETDRAQLLIRRTPQDSDVQVLTHRARDLENELGGIASSYLQSLSNQVASLQSEAAHFSGQLDALPAKALEAARLERDTAVLSSLSVMVQTRLKEAQVSSAGGDHTFRVVDAAAPPLRPARPRPLVNLALSLLLGTVIGMTGSFVVEMRDHSVRSRSDALAAGGLPVLGALPRLRLEGQTGVRALGIGRGELPSESMVIASARPDTAAQIAAHLITQPAVPAAYAESLNQLYASIALAHQDRPVKVVVFTSPLPGEGKTLSAVNFALAAALRGLRVLLIDGDLRCGLIGDSFGLRQSPGLTDLLAGTTPLERVMQRVAVGDNGTLVVIPSGGLPKMAASVLTIDRVKRAVTASAAKFDVVVIDTPPVNLLADAGILGAAADGVVLVVRAGHTQVTDIQYAMDQLGSMRAPVIGTLLNDVDLRRNARDDGSYRYLAEAGRYSVSAS